VQPLPSQGDWYAIQAPPHWVGELAWFQEGVRGVMKTGSLFLIVGLAAAGFFAAPTVEAKAETRFHLLMPGFPPPPPPRHYYYYPQPYDDEDYAYPYDDEDAYYYYGEDDDYYEPAPRQYSPKPRKKSKTVTVAPKEEYAPAPKVKKKPASTAARPATPTPKTEAKNAFVSCDKARSIITGYGFGSIETRSCSGNVYSFAAVRGGKNFSVKVSALNGELTEVKRQ
jgi:hypothetical protein